MIYYRDNDILIRDLEENDIGAIVAGEIAQGWTDSSADKFKMRLKHRDELGAIALVAEYLAQPAGYVNVYPNSKWGAFGGLGYCEIVDLAVLEKFRGKGIGNKLMDAAEKIAAEYSDTVYLGVGLHSGYGSAQRMYVKRGYIPDGKGVWYKDKVCGQYAECVNDDELNLYLSKKLK